MVFNMAPSAETVLKQPVLKFSDLKTTFKRLEEYYRLYSIDDDYVRIQRAKINADKEIMEILEKAKREPSKWEEFKKMIKDEKARRAMNAIIQTSPRHDESIIQWVERLTKIMIEYELPIKNAEGLAKRAIRNEEELRLCELTLKRTDEIHEWRQCIENLKGLKAQIEFEKKMKRINKANAEKRIRGKEKQVNKITLRKDKEQIKKENIKINGKEKQVIMDTGSQVNIMDRNVVDEEGLIIEKMKPQELTSIIGGKKTIKEKVQATIEKKGVMVNTEFMVTETTSPETILIGNPAMTELRIKKWEMEKLVQEFPEIFDMKPSEGYEKKECEIDTTEGKVVRIKQRKIPQALLEGARKAIDHLEELGYIEKSESSWYNPIKPVLKPNGEVRITSNMQFLNNLTEDNKYSIPNIQRVIEKCCNKRWFTVLDLKDGYYQIKLKKEHRYKTAFYFENKLYQWTRMPQGFKNSPAIFQIIMDEVLKDEIGKSCNVYLDDIIVYGKDSKEHDKNLRKVLEKLKANKLKVNPEKVQYKQEMVKLLGCMIDGKTRKPILEKKCQILEFKEPTSKKEMQRFLGFANYYRSYIKGFATLSSSLYELIKKNKKYEWKEEHQKAFNEIKQILNTDIAIHIPDFDKEFILKTDASNEGIGAILYQIHEGKMEVVDWASKKLTDAEKKFGISKEY